MTQQYELLADGQVIRIYESKEEAESKLEIARMGDSTHEFLIRPVSVESDS